MSQVERKIRAELASRGIEMTPDNLQQILHAGAHIASLVGGMCVIDSGKNWGLWIEQDGEEEDWFSVDPIWFDDDEDDSIDLFN